MFLLIAFKIFLKDIKFPLKFCQDQLSPVHRIGFILIYKKLKPLTNASAVLSSQSMPSAFTYGCELTSVLHCIFLEALKHF